MGRQNVQGLELGSIAQSYIQDLTKYGKAGMRKRLREASTRMIDRTLLWRAINQDKQGSWIPR